jgi:hypothetical protein
MRKIKVLPLKVEPSEHGDAEDYTQHRRHTAAIVPQKNNTCEQKKVLEPIIPSKVVNGQPLVNDEL